MKKLSVLLLAFFLIASSISAVPLHFVFSSLTQHPDILAGFIPSYASAGIGYNGISLIDGNTTDFQFIAGGGYINRKLWQNKDDGSLICDDPIIYDVIGADWSLRFVQGFLSSPVKGKDLITLTAGYNGIFECAVDSIVKGKERHNPNLHAVKTLDEYIGSQYGGSIYPDLNGDRRLLANELFLNIKFDTMYDDIYKNTGFVSYFEIKWSPKAMSGALGGFADYLTLTANAVGAYTFYQYRTDKMNWFSVTAIDRVNINYTTGSAVPEFVQRPVSLGRKVRGFNPYTYNTEFTAVNNFDIRLVGPELGINGIAPRINFFFDIGYGCGQMFNTDIVQSNVLSSTGVQLTATFFDFVDLGYQIAYLIAGNKYSIGSDKRIGTSVTFFLDF